MNKDKYEKLKQNVDRLQSTADRAEGALEELMTRLKTEFKCSTVKQAKKLLNKLKAEEEKLSNLFDDALEKFEQEHGNVLNT